MVTCSALRKRFARLNRCDESNVELEGISQMTAAEAKKFVDSTERFYDRLHQEIYPGYRSGEKVRLIVGNRIMFCVPGNK